MRQNTIYPISQIKKASLREVTVPHAHNFYILVGIFWRQGNLYAPKENISLREIPGVQRTEAIEGLWVNRCRRAPHAWAGSALAVPSAGGSDTICIREVAMNFATIKVGVALQTMSAFILENPCLPLLKSSAALKR